MVFATSTIPFKVYLLGSNPYLIIRLDNFLLQKNYIFKLNYFLIALLLISNIVLKNEILILKCSQTKFTHQPDLLPRFQ